MIQNITEKQFTKSYKSAGLWFVALYMEMFLTRIDELEDSIKKTKLIEEIFDDGSGPDQKENSTRTRVNCLYRIIKSGRVIQALEIAFNSKRLEVNSPNAYNATNSLLKRIRNGSFTIPKTD